jgi:phosphinothricin acetyltransferase
MIRVVTVDDVAALAEIYNHYIENTVITFEEEPVDANDMARRIEKVQRGGHSWLVALENGSVIGYAYAAQWHERAAYRHTAEVTVYLAANAFARGWGTKLYEALFADLRRKSIHVAIGGIALPNPASIALHEKFGMEKVAHFREVGFKFGAWIDVGYWRIQLSA